MGVDDDLEQRFLQLKGVAARRGERWADEIRERRGTAAPADRELAIAIARVKPGLVADLTDDDRLRDRLAAELVDWMMRRLSSSASR